MAVFCGLAALGGHLFPVWLDFKGGKGAATGIGIVFAMNWIAGALAMGVFVLALALMRMVSVSSILASAATPIAMALTGHRLYPEATSKHILTGFLAAMCLVVIVRHRANIARIFRGQERRLGEGEAARPEHPRTGES